MKSWKVRRSTIAFAWRYAIRYRVVATTLRSALAELLSGNRRAQPLRKMGIDHSSRARGHSPRTLAGLAFREAACPVSSETCVLAGTTRRFTSRACRATSDRPRLGRVEACDPPARDRVALPCGRNSHRAHPVTGRHALPGAGRRLVHRGRILGRDLWRLCRRVSRRRTGCRVRDLYGRPVLPLHGSSRSGLLARSSGSPEDPRVPARTVGRVCRTARPAVDPVTSRNVVGSVG